MNRTSARAAHQCMVAAIPALLIAADAPRDDDATVQALHDAAHTCAALARKRGVSEAAKDLIYTVNNELRHVAVMVGWMVSASDRRARESATWVAGMARVTLAAMGESQPPDKRPDPLA